GNARSRGRRRGCSRGGAGRGRSDRSRGAGGRGGRCLQRRHGRDLRARPRWDHRRIRGRRRGFGGDFLKKRVHEIAKQQGLTSKEVLAALKAAGIEAKVAASSVEEEDAPKALATS